MEVEENLLQLDGNYDNSGVVSGSSERDDVFDGLVHGGDKDDRQDDDRLLAVEVEEDSEVEDPANLRGRVSNEEENVSGITSSNFFNTSDSTSNSEQSIISNASFLTKLMKINT